MEWTCGIKNTSDGRRENKKEFLITDILLICSKTFVHTSHRTSTGLSCCPWVNPVPRIQSPESRISPSDEHTHETWMDTNPLLYFQLSIVVAISPSFVLRPPSASLCRCWNYNQSPVSSTNPPTQKKKNTHPVRIPCIILAHTLARCVELFPLDFISFYSLFFFFFWPTNCKAKKFQQNSFLMPSFHLTDRLSVSTFFSSKLPLKTALSLSGNC